MGQKIFLPEQQWMIFGSCFPGFWSTKWKSKCYLSSRDKQCRTQNHFCAHQDIWVSYLALEKGNSSFEIGNVSDHGNFVMIR